MNSALSLAPSNKSSESKKDSPFRGSVYLRPHIQDENLNLQDFLHDSLEAKRKLPLTMIEEVPELRNSSEKSVEGSPGCSTSRKKGKLSSFSSSAGFVVTVDNNVSSSELIRRPSLAKKENVFDSLSEEETSMEEDEPTAMLILANSLFYYYWENYVYFLIIYTITVTPIRIAFFASTDTSFFTVLDVIIDFSYICELVINFFVVHMDKHDNYVRNHWKVAMNYLNGYFFFDLLCAFPFGFINLFIEKDINNTFFRRISYVAWMRMIRIAKMKKMSSISKNSGRDTKQHRMKKKMFEMVKIVLLVFSTIHIFSCFYVYLGKSSLDIDNWISHNDLVEEWDIYFASIYFHLVTMYSIGYGDILAVNLKERVYNNIFMFISVMVYSFLISVSANYFTEKDKRTRAYLNKLEQLEKIRSKYKVNEKLYDKVKSHLKLEHRKIVTERYDFLKELPYQYKTKILSVVNKKYINNLRLFYGQTNDFIIAVLPLFKPLSLQKKDVLVEIGQNVSEMYCVSKGKLAITLSKEYHHIQIGRVDRYYHFGEILMYLDEQSPYQLQNMNKDSQVLVLKKEDFEFLSGKYNENILLLLQNSKRQVRELEKRKELVAFLSSYDNRVEVIKKNMRRVDKYVMTQGFDDIFYRDADIESVREKILEDKFEKIRQILGLNSVLKPNLKFRNSLRLSLPTIPDIRGSNEISLVDSTKEMMMQIRRRKNKSQVIQPGSIKMKKLSLIQAEQVNIAKKRKKSIFGNASSKSCKFLIKVSNNYENLRTTNFEVNSDNFTLAKGRKQPKKIKTRLVIVREIRETVGNKQFLQETTSAFDLNNNCPQRIESMARSIISFSSQSVRHKHTNLSIKSIGEAGKNIQQRILNNTPKRTNNEPVDRSNTLKKAQLECKRPRFSTFGKAAQGNILGRIQTQLDPRFDDLQRNNNILADVKNLLNKSDCQGEESENILRDRKKSVQKSKIPENRLSTSSFIRSESSVMEEKSEEKLDKIFKLLKGTPF